MSRVLLVGSVLAGFLSFFLTGLLPRLTDLYAYFAASAAAVGILASVFAGLWRSVAAGLCALATALGITAMLVQTGHDVVTTPLGYVVWPLPVVFFAAATLLVLWPAAQRRLRIKEHLASPGRPRISLRLLICAGSLIVTIIGSLYALNLTGFLTGEVYDLYLLVSLAVGLGAAAVASATPQLSAVLCLLAGALCVLAAERVGLLADVYALPVWFAQVVFYVVAAELCLSPLFRQKAGGETE